MNLNETYVLQVKSSPKAEKWGFVPDASGYKAKEFLTQAEALAEVSKLKARYTGSKFRTVPKRLANALR